MSKPLKIVLICLLILILAFFGLKYYAKNRLDDLMISRVSSQLGPDFEFDFKRSKLNFTGNDYRVFDLSISKKMNDTVVWSFSANSIQLTGFKYLKFLRGDMLATDSIVVNSPEMNLYRFDPKPKNRQKEERPRKNKELKEQVFQIDHIGINKASLTFDPEGPEELHSELNILIDDVSFQGYVLDMIDELDQMEIQFPNLSYTTPDSVYTIKTDLLSISKEDDFTSFQNFRVRSNISPTEYDRKNKWRKPLFDVDIDKISMSRPEFINDSVWTLNWLSLENPILKISKDDRFPLPHRKTDLPQTGLQNMNFKFEIDSIYIDSGLVRLVNVLSGQNASELFISEINGSVSHIQNHDYHKPAFVLDAAAKLMGTADFNALITYNYGENNPFSLDGNLRDTKLEFMDNFLQKHVGIQISKGQLDQLDFTMKGDENGVGGTVDFRYHDLHIHLVDKETGEKKEMLNLVSDAAGGLLFWKHNPYNEKLRSGNFYVERDVRKGFISQWVDGIMQGVIVTVSKVDPVKLKHAGKKDKKDKKHKNHHKHKKK